MRLQVASMQYPVRVLGPGNRLGIWLQGCLKRCPNCLSSDFLPLKGGTSYPIEQLFELVVFHHRNYPLQGLTISGGEPMLQWIALENFLRKIKAEIQKLDVIVFSGYTYSGSGRFSDAPSITAPELEHIVDLLVDGEYVEKLNEGQFMRGSENQRHLFFNPEFEREFRQYEGKSRRTRRIQLFAKTQFLAGIPDRDFKHIIEEMGA